MEKLTIHEIKERIEKVFPELIVGRDTSTDKLIIVSKESWREVAYAYHRKWVFRAAISDYSSHIGAIINLLDQWDGNSYCDDNTE